MGGIKQASYRQCAWAWLSGQSQPELYPHQARVGSLFTEGETKVQRGGGQHGGQVTIPGGAGTWHEYHESLLTTVWWTQCDGHCDRQFVNVPG